MPSLLTWGFLQICYCHTQEIAESSGKDNKQSMVLLGDLRGNFLFLSQTLMTFQCTPKLDNKAAK